jgi:hypothetical protein
MGSYVRGRLFLFDDKLYEYYISLTTYDADKSLEEIRGTLVQQFGKGQPDTDAQVPLVENLKWENSKQKVTMWMSKNEDKESGYHVGIRATHKGASKEIEDLLKPRKSLIFRWRALWTTSRTVAKL